MGSSKYNVYNQDVQSSLNKALEMCTLSSLKNERFLKLVHKQHNNHNLEKYKLYTRHVTRQMFRNDFEE